MMSCKNKKYAFTVIAGDRQQTRVQRDLVTTGYRRDGLLHWENLAARVTRNPNGLLHTWNSTRGRSVVPTRFGLKNGAVDLSFWRVRQP